MKRQYGAVSIRIQNYKRIDTPNGFTTVQVEPTDHTILIDIDMDRLARELGPKAVRSKKGRTQLRGGIITVTEKRR